MNIQQLDTRVIDSVVTEVLESMVFLGAEPAGDFDWGGGALCWSSIDLHTPVVGEMVIAVQEQDAAELFELLWAGERAPEPAALRALLEEVANAIAGQAQAQVDPSATAGLGLPTSGSGAFTAQGAADRRHSYTLDDGKVVGLLLRELV